jgi:TM2 domain-containing membrane protein YozV
LGTFGIHRFYTKSTGIGLIQLFTLGGCGIWVLIDLIMIVVGSFRDGYGKTLVNKSRI